MVENFCGAGGRGPDMRVGSQITQTPISKKVFKYTFMAGTDLCA